MKPPGYKVVQAKYLVLIFITLIGYHYAHSFYSYYCHDMPITCLMHGGFHWVCRSRIGTNFVNLHVSLSFVSIYGLAKW